MKSNPESVYELIWCTRRLFQQLRETSDELLEGTGINSSQRAVLEFLVRDGSQTVAAMARGRNVSRQHVQKVVNILLDLKLAEPRDNPDHKRSPLIGVTTKGRKLFEKITAGEARLLAALAKRLDEADVRGAVCTLERLGGFLESRPADAKPLE